jgi:septal ring factor EnvC (AmiA/AmiB activator)
MPQIPLSVLITIISMIFAAGVTYGIMKSKQKETADKANASENKIEEILDDLKEILKELKNLTMELHVMKASNIRNEADIAKHETRISALELAVAKLQAQSE